MRNKIALFLAVVFSLCAWTAFTADVSGNLLYDGIAVSETFTDVISGEVRAGAFGGGDTIDGTVDLENGSYRVTGLQGGTTYQLIFILDRPVESGDTYFIGDLWGYVTVEVENGADSLDVDADLVYLYHIVSPFNSLETLNGSGMDCAAYPTAVYPITLSIDPVPRAVSYSFEATLKSCPSEETLGTLAVDSETPSATIEWGTAGEDYQYLYVRCNGKSGRNICSPSPVSYEDSQVWALWLRNQDTAGRTRHHPDAVVIPAVASAAGAADTFWSSAVTLANLQSYDRTIEITFTPRGNDGMISYSTVSVTLPAFSQLSWSDVLDELFSTTGAGALEIRGNELAVTSRTSTSDGYGGSFGQGIPPLEQGGILSAAGTASATIGGLREDGEFRTNLGLCEVWGEELRVTVAVLDAVMRELGSETYDLRPYENIQINRVAAEIGGATNLGNGLVRVTVIDGEGRIGAYISIVDNSSGDPTFVSVAPPSTIGN